MSWPFVYVAGVRLSGAELTGARLDGDLVEVGEAFMPADAVETRELRAASLRHLVGDAVAFTLESAAWVHGALPEPPPRHVVQRLGERRLPPADPRVRYSDQPLAAPDDVVRISGVWVTTPARTLADLVRAAHIDPLQQVHVDAVLAWRPELAAEAIEVLRRGTPHHKRAAMSALREILERRAAQEEVTR